MSGLPRPLRSVVPTFFLAAIFAGLPAGLVAAVRPAALFTDHMVLQSGTPVPVWGTASPGETVTVSFAGASASATAAPDGTWRVDLPAMPPSSESRILTISGTNTHEFQDVVVGEVWICAGQSNMERQLGLRPGQQPLVNWEQEAASADYPLLRHFGVAQAHSDAPTADVTGRWVVCTPQTAPTFTAVGYYFGRDLLKQLNVPIGLIHTSWGGSPAEAWTRRDAIETHMPEVLAAHQKSITDYPALLAKFHAEEPKLLADWAVAAEKAKAAGKPEPRKPAPPRDPVTTQNRPSALFNAMVHPLIPYAMRGVIWYQGESNASRAKAYQTLFPLLISDWRQLWGQGDFPFLFVQIAPYKTQTPEIREAQLLTWKKTPNTAMVVTTDAGDAEDIHPTRKEPVGQRLALAARAIAYGEKIDYSGPVFESVTFEGSRALVTFSHADGGLVANGGPLRGFTLAGADGQHHPAEARIDGDRVVVTSESVPDPVAVRYGWANVPDVNLFDTSGLPASPFRSDVP